MRSPSPEYVLKLAADIVAARKALDSLQTEWDALFSAADPAAPVSRKPVLGGTASRILEIINSNPKELYGVERLHGLLEDTERKPIESSLFNLNKAGKILRHSRGLYKSLSTAIETSEVTDADIEEVFKF